MPGSRTFRNSLIYQLPFYSAVLTNLIALPIFNRLISAEEFGLLATAEALGVFALSLAGCGLPIGFERNWFQEKERGRIDGLLGSVLLWISIGWGGCLLASLAFSAWVCGIPTGELAAGPPSGWTDLQLAIDAEPILLTLVVAGLGAEVVQGYFMTCFKNDEQAGRHTTVQIGGRLGATLLGLLLVAGFELGLFGYALAKALVAIPILAWLAWSRFRVHPFALDRVAFADVLRLSPPPPSPGLLQGRRPALRQADDRRPLLPRWGRDLPAGPVHRQRRLHLHGGLR